MTIETIGRIVIVVGGIEEGMIWGANCLYTVPGPKSLVLSPKSMIRSPWSNLVNLGIMDFGPRTQDIFVRVRNLQPNITIRG